MDIRGFREKYGLSMQDLSHEVGVTWGTIWRWENKEDVRPNRVLLQKLRQVMRKYERRG